MALLFLLVSVLANPANAALPGPPVYWAESLGGPGDDWPRSIQSTRDGNYLVGGHTQSFGAGEMDYWILKMESDGNPLWQRSYGGPHDERPFALAETENAILVAGDTNSFGTPSGASTDVWLVKLQPDGPVSWQRTYGGPGADWARALVQSTDEGYAVVGRTDSFSAGGGDAWVLKVNADGSVAWQFAYGARGEDYGFAIQATRDGGFLMLGRTDSFGAGQDDVWLIKLNGQGAVEWQKTYGGGASDAGWALVPAPNDGFLVAAETCSFGPACSGEADNLWVFEIDSEGAVRWQKTIGGAQVIHPVAAAAHPGGGFGIAATRRSADEGGLDMWVVSLDAQGHLRWSQSYGGPRDDRALSLQPAAGGGFVVAGRTESFGAGEGDYWILKTGPRGDLEWDHGVGASTRAVPAETEETRADIRDSSALSLATLVIGQTSDLRKEDPGEDVTVHYQSRPSNPESHGGTAPRVEPTVPGSGSDHPARTPSLSPAIVLGGIALAAAAACGVRRRP